MYKEFKQNKKNKKKYHPNTFPTKIIELDEDKRHCLSGDAYQYD